MEEAAHAYNSQVTIFGLNLEHIRHYTVVAVLVSNKCRMSAEFDREKTVGIRRLYWSSNKGYVVSVSAIPSRH